MVSRLRLLILPELTSETTELDSVLLDIRERNSLFETSGSDSVLHDIRVRNSLS
jgi:hypothetical protein